VSSPPLIVPNHPPANTNVRFTKDEMQRELLEQMYRTQELDDLLRESDYTVRRRKECQQMVESLSRASQIVSEVQ
jgi:vacuolar protein sorting-associated protein 1